MSKTPEDAETSRHHWGAGCTWTRAVFFKYAIAPALLVAFCMFLLILDGLHLL